MTPRSIVPLREVKKKRGNSYTRGALYDVSRKEVGGSAESTFDLSPPWILVGLVVVMNNTFASIFFVLSARHTYVINAGRRVVKNNLELFKKISTFDLPNWSML